VIGHVRFGRNRHSSCTRSESNCRRHFVNFVSRSVRDVFKGGQEKKKRNLLGGEGECFCKSLGPVAINGFGLYQRRGRLGEGRKQKNLFALERLRSALNRWRIRTRVSAGDKWGCKRSVHQDCRERPRDLPGWGPDGDCIRAKKRKV